MKLTVLGCAGSFPGPESPCSAYLLEAEGYRLLLDFGTGALSTLQSIGALDAVDAIVLSHLHLDHMVDACLYVVVRRYGPDGPLPPLPLYGPTGVRERLTAVYGAADEGPLDDVYDFHELRPGPVRVGPFDITVDRVNHPVETYGMRIAHAGRVLAYSADTAMCEALLRIADKADAFLCEASYLDGRPNPPDLHLTGGEAGAVATKAGVGRLLLTHLVPAWGDPVETFEAASAAFAGPVTLVHPGDTYDI
jgi:ribonuclease BN (tRNA processing enzyme)